MPERKPDLKVHIIAPSSYDDHGTLKQYWKTLMLNPAFAVLEGIADKAAADLNLSIATAHHDERTELGDGYLGSIANDQSAHKKVVFITTKSHELPRAIDDAEKFRQAGVAVVIGGPGVTLADTQTYDHCRKKGISLNVGEGENTVPQIIQDVMNDQKRPIYWQRGFVDLRKAPLPRLSEQKDHDKTMTRYIAIGTSEGCPFGCSFCSVIIIRGRKITLERSRNVGEVIEWMEKSKARGFNAAMLTDDNYRFSATYKDLTREQTRFQDDLRRRGEKPFYLFNQLDAGKGIRDEAPRLAAAGIQHSFFGLENMDPLVLKDSNKKQNNPEEYRDIVNDYHSEGIAVSSGVMINFPKQTLESIRKVTRQFRDLVDLAHPYLVTPLPGTPDYFEAVRKGQLTTWDVNFYDSTHCVRDWSENLTPQQAEQAYWQSFDDLFSKSDILKKGGRLGVSVTARGYARILLTLGKTFYGRPFHFMMDGIPHIPPVPWKSVKRPGDGFRGFAHDSDDPAYQSLEANKAHKEEYLSKVAWSPAEEATSVLAG